MITRKKQTKKDVKKNNFSKKLKSFGFLNLFLFYTFIARVSGAKSF